MVKGFFIYNDIVARVQVALITECYDELSACVETAASLEDGQTSALWTADGKATELTAALKAKYHAAGSWLNDLSNKLDDACMNLKRAIAETEHLQDQQKAAYQRQLDQLLKATQPTAG